MDEKTVVLVDADLEMKSMIEAEETVLTTLTWTIMNFAKLANNVPYKRYGSLNSHDWDLKVIKLDQSLSFLVQAEYVNQFLIFAIIGKDNQILNGAQSIGTTDGEFIVKFNMDVILDPKNGYLQNDSSVVQCKYVDMLSSDKNIRVIPWDEHRERLDLFEFQEEWRQMYLQSRFYDFKIIAQGNVFYTHKVILTARSQFFAEHFAKGRLDAENEFVLSASPYILHEVLMFMYTGELVNMHITVLFDVFELALDMRIRTLVLKCFCTLRIEMSNHNVILMYLKAQQLHHEYLVKICEKFMEDNCPENLEMAQSLQNRNSMQLLAAN